MLRAKYVRALTLSGLTGILLFGYQNCFKASPGSNDPGSTIAVNGAPLTTSKCVFLTPELVEGVVNNIIGLKTFKFAADDPRKSLLGAAVTSADGLTYSPADAECNSVKYKTMIEIYAKACLDAYGTTTQSKADFTNRLFPNGVKDPSKIFLLGLGRNPLPAEVAVIQSLINSIGPDKAAPAACTAVLSSVEAASRS